MAADCQNGNVTWLTLTISVISFLRFVFEKQNILLDCGFTIVADDSLQARQFVRQYSQAVGNAVKIQTWNTRTKKPANFYTAFMIFQQGKREAEVMDFLTQEDFFPIVIVGGCLPDYLKSGTYIFRLSEDDMLTVCNPRFSEEIKNFKEFSVKNIGNIVDILKKLDTSIAITENKVASDFRQIHYVFAAVVQVWALYVRNIQDERTVVAFRDAFSSESLQRIYQIGEFVGGHELEKSLSSLIWQYVKSNGFIHIGSIGNVDGRLQKSIEDKQAILYDSEHYYLSEGLFMKVCQPLLDTVSRVELKRQLNQNGVIYCNAADYTIKKQYISVFGTTHRIRVMAIKKEKCISEEGLFLEDILEENSKEEVF